MDYFKKLVAWFNRYDTPEAPPSPVMPGLSELYEKYYTPADPVPSRPKICPEIQAVIDDYATNPNLWEIQDSPCIGGKYSTFTTVGKDGEPSVGFAINKRFMGVDINQKPEYVYSTRWLLPITTNPPELNISEKDAIKKIWEDAYDRKNSKDLQYFNQSVINALKPENRKIMLTYDTTTNTKNETVDAETNSTD